MVLVLSAGGAFAGEESALSESIAAPTGENEPDEATVQLKPTRLMEHVFFMNGQHVLRRALDHAELTSLVAAVGSVKQSRQSNVSTRDVLTSPPAQLWELPLQSPSRSRELPQIPIQLNLALPSR